MNKTIVFKAHSLTYHGSLFLMLFLSINTFAIANISSLKNQSDSLKTLVEKSKVDTIRFKILANFYWTHANRDFNRVKLIGEWAYNH